MRCRILIILGVLAAVLGIAGGAAAVAGRLRYGDAGWYVHFGLDYRLSCGQAQARRGRFDRAEQIALSLDAAGAQDYAALLRGELYFREGKFHADAQDLDTAKPLLANAVQELNKVRGKGALRRQAAVLLGQCCVYLKDSAAAINALLFVLSEDPDNLEAHRGLAAVYYDQGAFQAAIRHLDKVAELAPDDGRPFSLQGAIYKDLEQYNQAIAAYQKALERDLPAANRVQHPAFIRLEIAECYVKKLQFTQALEVLQNLEPLAEDRAKAKALQAECLIPLERADEAKRLLDDALQHLDPDHPDLLRLRAKIYLTEKSPKVAAEMLEKALRIDRHDYQSRHLLVQAYRALGLKSDADYHQKLVDQTLKDMQELSRLNRLVLNSSRDAAVYLKMAELYEKLDRIELGRLARRAAAACPPLAKPPEVPGEKPVKSP
jgi:tetratricopeptide (TPR) repeat protein